MTASVGHRTGLSIGAALLCGAGAIAGAQAAAAPVVAVGQGRTVSAAISAAVGMAMESGAGATVVSAVSSSGERLTADSTRTVSRGVVTRYVLLDSSTVAGGKEVRILAMVSRISERAATGATGRRVAVPGRLWGANADADAARRAREGDLLAELFSAIDRQPSAYAYEIEAGPPVASGAARRLRLRVIRTPAASYTALRDRARAILAAVAGPAGTRTTHLPALDSEQIEVRPCVSHCGPDERRVLNARVALDDTDSLGAVDPPVLAGTRTAPLRTLFPNLPTVGGFAVAFGDSAEHRQEFVHVRSTRGYLAVVDYLRTTFDDARFRVEIGDRAVDLMETLRAAYSGQPVAGIETTAPPGALPIVLVRGFRSHTRGGPGAPTTLGSPYVVITVPPAAEFGADTALVDVWLTPEEVFRIAELGVAPLSTTHRLPVIRCPVPARGGARLTCTRPPAADLMWRALDDPSGAVAALAAGMLPAGSLPSGSTEPSIPPPPIAPARRVAATRQSPSPQPAIPLAVIDAIARAPLADGDGALAVSAAPSPVVAVGSGVVDPAAPTQACAVARLRAQRELVRFLSGSHVESRIGLSTAENRGAPVEEHFREDIAETTAGRVVGAAIAAQWNVSAPLRCRVALWIPGDTGDVRNPGAPPLR